MNGRQEIELKLVRVLRFKRVFVIACLLLLVTNITSLYWVYKATAGHEHVNEYPLVDPSREFISQEDAVTNLQPLRDYLKELGVSEKDIDISIYFEYLNTGANISINPDTRFTPASLIKLPVAMVAMKKIELGTWQADNELVVTTGDLDVNSGDLYKHYVVGSRFKIADLVKISLEKSDNTAHNMLFRNLSGDDTQTMIDAIGLYDLFDNDLQVTAKEYSRIARALYTASYLRREQSQQVLEWLTQAEFKDHLSQGIPADVRFAHKYGVHKELGTYSDSGIVYYPNRPYILTVMIHGKDKDFLKNKMRAESLMKQISQKSIEYVKDL
jgi:beta-lactamase class A